MYLLKTVKLNFTILLSLLLLSSNIFSQDDFSDEGENQRLTVSGTVSDASSGKPIAGANVIVDDGDLGAAADGEGKFSIEGVEQGASITASAIGYEDLTIYADSSVVNFTLSQVVLELGALDVIAPNAKFRETPVAFTDVSREELDLRLGSRDLSMIFNEVPGAYASMLGGGAGDSRVSIRGFDQRNICLLYTSPSPRD